MAKVNIKAKSVPITFGDGWLVRLEKAAFGWVHIGKHSERTEWDEEYEDRSTSTHYDSYADILVEETTIEKGVRRKSSLTTYHDFVRVSPYSYNAIFHLFEFLSSIFSWVRRLAVAWFMFGFFILIALGAINLFLGGETMLNVIKMIGGVLIIYVIFIVIPSLIVSGLGFLLRKVMGIDEKVSHMLEKNNYYPNWRDAFKNK